MKKLFLIIMVIPLLFNSCERVDYGDLNLNPTLPTENNIDALFRGGVANTFTLAGRDYLTNTTLFCQYQAQTQYTSEQLYADSAGSWQGYFANRLSDFNEVNHIMTDIRGGTENIRAMSEILSILIWKRITDTWGDVPYSQALLGSEDVTPSYDSQQSIYLDLLARAKAARNMLNAPDAFIPNAATDILYGGDLSKWQKLSNSLIMAIALQMSNKMPSPTGAAAVAFNEALSNGPMTSNADNLVFAADLVGGFVNAYSASRPGDYRVTKEFTDALNGNAGPWGPAMTDPKNPTSNTNLDIRIFRMTANGTADGLPYGYTTYSNTTVNQMTSSLNQPASDLVLFTAAYTYLLRAEAGGTLGWTGESQAAMLTTGIETSYAQWNLPASNATTYATTRVADAGTFTFEQVIGEEKWVALFPDGYAGWAEQRRTGFPALTPAVDALNGGIIPRRFKYPQEEAVGNNANWTAGQSGLTPAVDANTSKPWFMN